MEKKGIDTSVWHRPDIGDRLTPVMRSVLQGWGGVTDSDLITHLHAIRDQAWPLGEYPCIGLWMFLLPGLAMFPEFPLIIDKAKAANGGIVLDLGSGLGQELRLLASHGVPTERMRALDVDVGLWELGYELFRDRGRFEAGFIIGDILNLAGEQMGVIKGGSVSGKVNLVIAAQLLHLFDWDGQVVAAKGVVGLSNVGTMVVGYQQGRKRARGYLRPWGISFYHNRDSFLRLWGLVQEDTKTEWAMDVREVPLQEWGMVDEDLEWMPEDHTGINFVLTRVS